jgi:hypothetical protein
MGGQLLDSFHIEKMVVVQRKERVVTGQTGSDQSRFMPVTRWQLLGSPDPNPRLQ